MAVRLISSYRREVDENRALLGQYAASNPKYLRIFMENPRVQLLTLEDGTQRLFRKVGREFTLQAV